MKRILILILILSGFFTSLSAQTALDALRYSRIFYNGTSRFLSTSGAFGAVGADFSTLATNPAGLGLYRTAEITLSPSLFSSDNSSAYNGYYSSDYKVNLALANFGYIYTFLTDKKGKGGGLKSISVGFGMNRQNNFNNNLFIEGPNHTSSLLNSFTDILNTPPILNPNDVRNSYPFDIGLAYDCGLIFYDTAQHKYLSDMPNGGVFQEKSINTWGSINEFELSIAGNINDRVYVGLTIGVPSIRYFYQSTYREKDSGDSIPYFQSLKYDYTFETHGTGVNFKAGVIVRPADWLRIGGAVHTPTWYPDMYDYYVSRMSAVYDSVLNYPVQFSPSGIYEYQLMTPFRAIGSVAFFIGKHGFVTGEYEYANFNQARFRAPGDSFTDVNSEISGNYKAPLNIRFGTEWRIFMFRLRGGFGYYGGPDKTDNIGERYTISGGLGLFVKRFFVDVAYQFARSTGTLYLYDQALVNPADLTIRNHTATATLGFKF